MPYKIPLPDGRYAQFSDDIEPDTARREIMTAFPEWFSDEDRAYFDRQDVENKTSALGRGFRAAKETTIGHLGALGRYGLGGSFEDLQKDIAETEKIASEQNPYATNFGEVQEAFGEGFFTGLERLGSFAGESLGASIPYMAGTLVGGIGGTLVGGPGGGIAGAVTGGAPQFVADNIARQVQEGAKSPDDLDILAAVGAGVAQSGLNAVGPVFTGIIGRGIMGPVMQQAAIRQTLDKLAKIPGGRFAAAGVSASQVEGLTEVLQTALERSQAGLEPFENEETLAAYTGGAMLGLIMGGSASVITRKKAASEEFDPEPVEDPVVTAKIPETPLALPPPSTELPRRPIFDIRPESGETPQAYAERAIRVAGADFPAGPYTQIQTDNGFQIVSQDGDYVGQPFATADQAQEVLNVYNERAADIAQAKEIREAIKNTRQEETEALVTAARESISPIGTFNIDEVGPDIAGRVNARRMQRGLNALDEFSLEELAKAKIPEGQITQLINDRRPATTSEVLQASDVREAAASKNLVSTDENFNIFARRTTGTSNVDRMNQTQLRVLRDKINELPTQRENTTIPVVDEPPFTDAQYEKAVSAIQQEGRFTQSLLSAHTNIRDRKTLQALRDKMVDRGVLVKRNANDYRLSDVLGRERRITPADLPEGATRNHVVREVAQGALRLRKNGKSLGTFESETEARAKIRNIRDTEAKKGLAPSKLELQPAQGNAFAVMENRYDAEGNFLGSAPVDTRKTRGEAQFEADRLDGREDVQSRTTEAPAKKAPPEALKGRVGDVLNAMKNMAYERELPLLGTRVQLLGDEIPAIGGGTIEGMYSPGSDVIFVVVRDLSPDMTTQQIVDRLAQVMDHEIIHALREHGILSEDSAAWKTLDRYVRKTKRPEGNETYYQFAERMYQGRAGYDTPADITGEAISEAFRYWASDRRTVTGKPASVFRQIVEWFKRLVGQLPQDIFEAIESGDIVRDAFNIPGDNTIRAQTVEAMEQVRDEINLSAERSQALQRQAEANPESNEALEAQAEASNVKQLEGDLRRLQAQASEDRRGRTGPATILGSTPSKDFAIGPRGDATRVRDATNTWRKQTGDVRPPLNIYLEEPSVYLKQVADVHERAKHDPNDVAVMRAYNALTGEIKKQFSKFSNLELRVWSEAGEPYANPAEMYSDIEKGQLNWRMSNDMFAGSPGIAGHPMFEPAGFKTVDGRDLTFNDLLRFLHEYYGHGQYMFGYTPRDYYNAFHQHARLFSDVARPALAAETLGPMSWQNAGAHMRRANGTVPEVGDVDFLSLARREFAPHKAYIIPEEILSADPGLEKIRRIENIRNTEIIDTSGMDEPVPFNFGTHVNARLEPWGKDTRDHDMFVITDPEGAIIGQVMISPTRVGAELQDISRSKDIPNVELGEEVLNMEWSGNIKNRPSERIAEFEARRADQQTDFPTADLDAATMRDMATWLVERYPDARWINGYRSSDTRGTFAQQRQAGSVELPTTNQLVSTEPFRKRLQRHLPGGAEYGRDVPLGSEFSPPDTQTPKFSFERDGNEKFGGEVANAQLQMARTGEDGAYMVYMTPQEFFRAVGNLPLNAEQDQHNEMVKRGYRYNTLPGLTVSGNGGVVSVKEGDGLSRVRALDAAGITQIPVMIYPDGKTTLDMVTGYQGKDGRLPAFNRVENMPLLRNKPPRYSLKAPLGNRVPPESNVPDALVSQTIADNIVTRSLEKLSRSKKEIPFLGFSVFDARVKLQDRMLPVKDMVEKIKKAGGRVSDFANTYMIEGLMNDKIMFTLHQKHAELYTPLFQAIKRSPNITYDDVRSYAYALHTPERNAEVRRRGVEDLEGSGMSDDEARAVMDKFAKENKLAALEAIEPLIARIRDDTTKTRIQAGLISAEAAAESPFKFYVPLRGFAEEDLDPDLASDAQYMARVRRGFSVYGREDPSFAGRKSKAGDVISNLIQQNIESQLRAGRNEVAQSFLSLIRSNPDNGFGKVLERVPTVRKYIQSRGRVQRVPDPNYRNRPDIFIAKENGKDVIMQLNDPEVAKAMKGAMPGQSGVILRALQGLNRYLSLINTAYNPEFLISNLARDMQTARVLIEQSDVEGLPKSILRDVPNALAAIRRALREDDLRGEFGQYFKEMREDGAVSEFYGIDQLENQIRRIQNEAANLNDSKLGQVRSYMGRVGKFIEDYNRAVENSVRLSAYANARRRGVSRLQAADLAKNLTINFNRGGEWKSVINSLYLFYNASLQGSFILLKGLKNPKVQKITAGIVVAGALQDALNRAMAGDSNGNGINDYDEIPDYILEHNFILMDPLGVMEAIGSGSGYFAFPMPYGFNAFHNLGRNMSGVLSGSPNFTGAKAAGSIVGTFANSFNPISGNESFVNFIAPTIMDPFIDMADNRDFADRPIIPERPTFGLPVPDSQLYWNSTAGPFKWTAEKLNELTGGSVVRKGMLDISPESFEYFYDYALGAAGSFVKRAGTFGQNVTSATLAGDFENIEVGEIPFLRKVVGSVTERGNTQAYYEHAAEIQTAIKELEHFREIRDREGVQYVLENYGTEIRMGSAFKSADKSLQDLRKRLREVRDNANISDERRELLIENIEDRMDSIMARMNRLYYSLQGG